MQRQRNALILSQHQASVTSETECVSRLSGYDFKTKLLAKKNAGIEHAFNRQEESLRMNGYACSAVARARGG